MLRFFRSEKPAPPAPAPPKPAAAPRAPISQPVLPQQPAGPAPKVPIIDGWTENDLVAVYSAAPAKYVRRGDLLFSDVAYTDSFFVLIEGSIQVVVKLNGQPGRPGLFKRGDCLAPLPGYPALSYSCETAEDSKLIEIPGNILKHLSDKTQLAIYKAATKSTSSINAYIRTVNGEMMLRQLRLSQYILNQNAERTAAVQTEFVKTVIQNMKRMPVYATDLAMKLLDDNTSVQEVVEGIRLDPSLVSIVLRTVNSAQYGFGKKIESFYHACMILGFNNIYNLLMREAAMSTMPVTRETTRIHKHACLISMLCFEIASHGKEQQAQTSATIGLLHDIGKGLQVVMRMGHPDKSEYIQVIDSGKLGGSLLRTWGLPEKICRTVEFQKQPEFMAPDLIAPEYRREAAALHIAHILEALLLDKPIDPVRSIYTSEHMALLGFGNTTPSALLKDRILPSLLKNPARIPLEIHSIITKQQQRTPVVEP